MKMNINQLVNKLRVVESTQDQQQVATRNQRLATNNQQESTRNQQESTKKQEFKFVRPLIEPEQFKQTLLNYRKHIDAYNKSVNEYNSPFRHFNTKYEHSSEHALAIWKFIKEELPQAQSIEEHNEMVLAFNAKHKLTLVKYKYKQTVKPNSLLYFEAILHEFAVQLQKRDKINISTNKAHKSNLPQVRINSYFITRQERAGVLNLDVSTRTVRNHLDRLEDAGILLNRTFGGTNAPLKFDINPEILTIFDAFSSKSQNAQNQAFTLSERKEFQHTKDTTRALNKNKIKEIPKSQNKEFAAQSLKDLFDKSTKAQDMAKPDETSKKIAQKKVSILNYLDRVPVLAQKLASGEYDHYLPHKTEDLQKLITDPLVTDEDFREIVIQDVVKYSAQLWKNNHASVGSWYEALRHIYNTYGTLNFKGKAMPKNKLYTWAMMMRYRLNYAINWFSKREWDGVWFPNIYFDRLRKLPSDVCFEYTLKVYKNKVQKRYEQAEKRRIERWRAERREKDLAAHRAGMRKLDGFIYRYLREEISLDDVVFALNTMLPSVQAKFDERLTYLTNKRVENEAMD